MLPSTEGLLAAPTHFRMLFFAAVVSLVRQAVEILGDFQAVAGQFPFLAAYTNELAAHGLDGMDIAEAPERWHADVMEWESAQSGHLPLRALREHAGLEWMDMLMLAGVGLVEEDLRFAAVFDALHGVSVEQRPSAGLLAGWDGGDAAAGMARLRRLVELGLLEVINPAAPAPAWGLRFPPGLWPALRGEGAVGLPKGVRYFPQEASMPMGDLVLNAEIAERISRLPDLVAAKQVDVLTVRGFAGGGRRTLVGAIARKAGFATLEIDRTGDGECMTGACALAAALGALPVFVTAPEPGQSFALPAGLWPGLPTFVILGRQGGIALQDGIRTFMIELPMPNPETALALWRLALPDDSAIVAETLAQSRIAAGAIMRIGAAARVQAAARGESAVNVQDVRAASRSLGREALDALATHVPADGDWDDLAVDALTRTDLERLEFRCRQRQTIAQGVGHNLAARLPPGVRALFSGPSGTGKSYAARLLAARLEKDLYACNLAAVVSKYIGETPKHLDTLLEAAESLDVLLVFEEADSVLGKRTETMKDATDRYANMESNFMLQRLEYYGGIVVFTTNLPEAVDSAFLRRLDAIVEFPAPSPFERLKIFRSHLPSRHGIGEAWLNEVATRCKLTGGQIRNVVIDTALVAHGCEGGPDNRHLDAALRREYRRAGEVFPLSAPIRGN